MWKDGLHLLHGRKSTLANNFINHLNSFYRLELEYFTHTILIYTHKIHKHTQQILNENNEDCESIFTPSSNLRHETEYETGIKKNEKKCPLQTKTRKPQKNKISHIKNSEIRNKSGCLSQFTKNKVDIIMI